MQGDGGDGSLIGGNQGDFLFGDQGNDRFYGDSGDDLIISGRGFDTMTGARGHDTFAFRLGDGVDEVRDIDPGRDVIDLPGTAHLFLAAARA